MGATGLFVALLYGGTSISITFFNKAVLSVYDFNFPNLLTLIQMMCSLTFLLLCRHRGWVEAEPLSWRDAKQVAPVALCFSGMVMSGLAALRLVNVPMFGALRRLTTLIVVVGQYVVMGRATPADEVLAVVSMVLGALVAGLGDITSSLSGLVLVFINCLVTAGYLVCIGKLKKDSKMNTFTQMLYNNLLSLVPMILVVSVAEVGDELARFPHWSNPIFLFCLLMSATQAFLLNWFIFLCSRINSPLTTSVTGQIKGIVTTIFGFLIFDDTVPSPLMIVGLTVSSVASIVYARVKYMQQHAAVLPTKQKSYVT